MELLKNIGINKYVIKLVEGKQLLYGPIYSLSLMKIAILKTYIETYLKTRFIMPSKSPVSTPILFDKKPDRNLRLYVNY